MALAWDIKLEGRSWSGEEARKRRELRPDKLEVWEGKLLWDDDWRINLLGLLLENLGLETAVRLGELKAWEEALAAVRDMPRELFPRPIEGLEASQ